MRGLPSANLFAALALPLPTSVEWSPSILRAGRSSNYPSIWRICGVGIPWCQPAPARRPDENLRFYRNVRYWPKADIWPFLATGSGKARAGGQDQPEQDMAIRSLIRIV